MKPGIMTLGRSGTITSPHKIANVLFYHAFYSQVAQSRYFNSQVFSIQDIFYKHDTNENTIINGLREGLIKHYEKYFDNVSVVVEITDANEEPHMSVDVSIRIKTTTGDIDLFYNLQDIDKSNLRLIEFNNTGEAIHETYT